jgi:diamine N-acetyltransferase
VENTVIEEVKADEIDSLIQISRQTFIETFSDANTAENMKKYLDDALSPEKLTKELLDPHSQFYFARCNGQITGYLKLNLGHSQNELKESNSLEIERIYILGAFRGRKIGQLLFEKAIYVAKKMHVDFVWLGVWEHNTAAIKFYRKNGFAGFDRHIFILGDDVQTDIMMKLQL